MKLELSHEINQIGNSSAPRVMGQVGAFPSQVWTPAQKSLKIWLLVNLHGLGLPCYISNPEGIRNLSNLFLEAPQCLESASQGKQQEAGTCPRRAQARPVPICRAQWVEHHVGHCSCRPITGNGKRAAGDPVPHVGVNLTKALLLR